jgi:peptidyl-prolyl cis-trans isomerase B (cyclophilin B)
MKHLTEKSFLKNWIAVAVAAMVVLFCVQTVWSQQDKAAQPDKPADESLTIKTPEQASAAGLKTEIDKVSYIIGTQIGMQLSQMTKAQNVDLNVEALVQGLRDIHAGKASAIGQEEAQKIMMEFGQKKQAEMQSKQDTENAEKIGKDNMWKLKLEKPEMMTFDPATDYFWVLETSKGKIKIKLMPTVAPMHVTSTIFLTKKGFYDGLTFHRIIPGFMAQGGCPVGNGTGGPGYKYDGEFSPEVKHDRPYMVSMANAGPGTDGSQFFITFKAVQQLDGKHTIFGEVTDGKEVVNAIEKVGSPSGKPTEEVKITKAAIEEVKK